MHRCVETAEKEEASLSGMSRREHITETGNGRLSITEEREKEEKA